MRLRLSLLLVLVAWTACSTGGSGGSDDPPGTVFAETHNSGLAVSAAFDSAAALDPFVLVAVDETAMDQDLNHDGDILDRVVACIDTTTDEITYLEYAVRGPFLASSRMFAFLAVESDHGYTDFNKDGDYADAAWFVYEPTQPVGPNNPQNTNVATPASGLPAAATEGGFVFLNSESASGVFLNGDLDQFDNLVAVYDDQIRAIISVGAWTHSPNSPLVARAGRVLVASSESFATADLNQDGDLADTVLSYVDFNLGTPILRPVGGPFPRAVSIHPYRLTETGAVYFIDEASEGLFDQNSDGDAMDAVLAVFDIAGLTGERLPRTPLVNTFGIACSPALGIAAAEQRAVVAIDEGAQGTTDFNGDGDSFDRVLAWVDTAASPGTLHVMPTALAQTPLLAAGRCGLVAVSEMSQGTIVGTDLNGDGDTDDGVAFKLDMTSAPGVLSNLGYAVTTLALVGDDVLLGVPEAGHFHGDINGNGIVGDVVSFYFDFSDSPPTQRGLAVIAPATTFFRQSEREVRLAAVLPEGQSQSFDDLNHDGDDDDLGLVLFSLDPSSAPPTMVQPTPFFAGTGGIFPVPPLRVGNDIFAFPSSELNARVDLNGDGDIVDFVLQYVRYTPPEE